MYRILQTFILCLFIQVTCGQYLNKTTNQPKSTITGTLPCDNWLYLPTQPAAVEVGQLNVAGNIITVEALINRTTPYTGGILYAGDVVSKHSTPADANYLLRPNEAEITTSNGYFRTPDICEIELNKTYHIAMVYDGDTLKFYRNGFLMSQIAATGDLFQNTWPTRIGYYFSEIYNTNFIGYINEVRIWNVARTQAEIQTYMYTTLPSPTTQTGLLAYYQFNNLLNVQGNPAWNGTIVGSAVANQTNPTCSNFIADSCCPILQGTLTGENLCMGNNATLTFNSTTGIAPYTLIYSDGTNEYTQNNVQNNLPFTLATQPTSKTTYSLISIQDASSCAPTNVSGITASINVTNCALCNGSLGDPVVDITFGSGISTFGPPLQTTSTGYGYQNAGCVIDNNYEITNSVTNCYVGDWHTVTQDHTGNPGGYFMLVGASDQPSDFYLDTVRNLCGGTNYQFSAWVINMMLPTGCLGTGGLKPNITFSIEDVNGNKLGVYNTGDIGTTTLPTWVQYGLSFTTPANTTDIVLRMTNNGPGGCGNDIGLDDITFRPCGPLITASFSQTISEDSLKICSKTATTIYGAAPGSLTTPNFLWQVSSDSGVSWTDIPNSNTPVLPINAIGSYSPKLYTYRLMAAEGNNINSPNCRTASNLVTLFINPLPVGFLSGETICSGDASVLAFTDSAGLAPFSIIYNIGTNNFTQSNLPNNAIFPVPFQLTDTTIFNLFSITDLNGCIDTINSTTSVNVNQLPQGSIAGNSICAGDSASFLFTATSGNSPFSVVISEGINTYTYNNILSGIPFLSNPLFSTTSITMVSITDNTGCIRTNGFQSSLADITVNPSPILQFDSLKSVCMNDSSFLITQAKEISGITGLGKFSGQGVDSMGLFSPSMAGIGVHEITYTYTATDGCAATKGQPILVNKNPVGSAGADLIACANTSFQLSATGGDSYLWSPTEGLSNPAIPNPVVTISSSTLYTVIVTDLDGCSVIDSVLVTVSPVGKNLYVVPNAFTPNGDGKNDCFGIQRWGSVNLLQFSVYNRYGELIFNTKNPFDCWDGTFHGNKQETGTYVYIIRAQTPCGEVNLKGTVVLIR
jgi:gliding motility-associated-like protein